MPEPVITLDTIVRDDSRSLARALESASPLVDKIIVGIDDRTTDSRTEQVARDAGAEVHVFGYRDVGLSEVQWKAGLIHFSNARNIGRRKVTTPWAFFLDSDEYVVQGDFDLRSMLRRLLFTQYNSAAPRMHAGSISFLDAQRIARTHLRWSSPSHNQLRGAEPSVAVPIYIEQDVSLRPPQERERRRIQRDEGVKLLIPSAEDGDMHALFHLAKHEAHNVNYDAADRWAVSYLKESENRNTAEERATVCVIMAICAVKADRLLEAEMWATRALLNGPQRDAFMILADMAKRRGDHAAFRVWEKGAKMTPPRQGMMII